MPRAYMVYNPAAGRYPSWLLTERAANLLRSSGWEIRLTQTQNSMHIVQLARQAAKEEMDAFFVVGGDGSINQAIQGLVGTETALAVLPAGTANVWAQELGLPGLTWTRWMALEESALRLSKGVFRKVDLGVCNGRPFLLWAGVGLDAFIVHHIEPRTRWEKHFAVVQYVASAIRSATLWHGIQLEAKTNGQVVSGHFLLAVVNNIHLYAGGFTQLSPDARLDDGLMDLWLFRGENLSDTVQRVWDLLSGRREKSDQVERISFQSLSMTSISDMYVQVDGEPVEIRGDISIHVQPRALRVLVPEDTPHTIFGSQEVG
jgi:diacylglycerol kinase (ATP)